MIQDLHAFGFQNDLSRNTVAGTAATATSTTRRANRTTTTSALDDFSSDEESGAAITPASNVPAATTSRSASAAALNTSTSSVTSTSSANMPTTTIYQSVSLADLTDNCRSCLLNILFYESGLSYSETATKAIAQKLCFNDIQASEHLLTQVRNDSFSFFSKGIYFLLHFLHLFQHRL
jgi:hypothetical protein